jgi:hypothetical protein
MPAITNSFLDRLQPSETGTTWYSDNKMSGFQVAVGKKTKTFYAFTVIKGRAKRIRLGYYPAISSTEARTAAMQAIAQFKMGDDPRRTKDVQTLEDVFARATRERQRDGRISDKTADYYRYVFDKYLSRYANRLNLT